ncbi:MAG: YgiQ family radical SAM protein, partial [Candidatus Omnitrophica bacterium]|nr:YgiQ family radical SAM protein [Candidatus Omnitrophota bacterium]
RRLSHYDYWDDEVRRSILLDAKADMIIYGMGECQIVEIIDRLDKGEAIDSIRDVRGTVVSVKKTDTPADAITLPSFEEVRQSDEAFNKAFRFVYEQMNSRSGRIIAQPHADRCVLELPPALPLSTKELDAVYDLPYTRAWHPSYDSLGGVKGFETVRWSITALRGCPGECSFCSFPIHQGRIVQSRSEQSVLAEAKALVRDPAFKGTITDVGGPTANLYGAACRKWEGNEACSAKQCLMPSKCPSLELGYAKCLALYQAIQRIPGVKHLFLSSGFRYDLLTYPEAERYLKEVCEHYISGQMKVAPEHTEDSVLELMNKPPYRSYEEFVKKFEKLNLRLENRRYLVNYFISAHPGSRLDDALSCAMTLLSRNMRPEQVQDFIPLPMTVSSCLYHTGVHPFSGKRVFVPKEADERAMQRALLQSQNPKSKPLIKKALRILHKGHLLNRFMLHRVSRKGKK